MSINYFFNYFFITCSNAEISTTLVDKIYKDKNAATFLCYETNCDADEKKSRLKEDEKIHLKNGGQLVLVSSTRESSNNFLAIILNKNNKSKILFSDIGSSIEFIKNEENKTPDFYFIYDTVSYNSYTRELYKWKINKYVLSGCISYKIALNGKEIQETCDK